jgi:hypothetical protein
MQCQYCVVELGWVAAVLDQSSALVAAAAVRAEF